MSSNCTYSTTTNKNCFGHLFFKRLLFFFNTISLPCIYVSSSPGPYKHKMDTQGNAGTMIPAVGKAEWHRGGGVSWQGYARADSSFCLILGRRQVPHGDVRLFSRSARQAVHLVRPQPSRPDNGRDLVHEGGLRAPCQDARGQGPR